MTFLLLASGEITPSTGGGGGAPTYDGPAPIGEWRFAEGAGTTVADEIGANDLSFGAAGSAPSWIPEGVQTVDDYLTSATNFGNVPTAFVVVRLDDAAGYPTVVNVGPNFHSELRFTNSEAKFGVVRGYADALLDPTPVAIGDWHSFCAYLENGAGCKLYRDATEVDTGTSDGPLPVFADDLYVGRRDNTDNGPSYLQGAIAWLALFDVELTPTQVQSYHTWVAYNLQGRGIELLNADLPPPPDEEPEPLAPVVMLERTSLGNSFGGYDAEAETHAKVPTQAYAIDVSVDGDIIILSNYNEGGHPGICAFKDEPGGPVYVGGNPVGNPEYDETYTTRGSFTDGNYTGPEPLFLKPGRFNAQGTGYAGPPGDVAWAAPQNWPGAHFGADWPGCCARGDVLWVCDRANSMIRKFAIPSMVQDEGAAFFCSTPLRMTIDQSGEQAWILSNDGTLRWFELSTGEELGVVSMSPLDMKTDRRGLICFVMQNEDGLSNRIEVYEPDSFEEIGLSHVNTFGSNLCGAGGGGVTGTKFDRLCGIGFDGDNNLYTISRAGVFPEVVMVHSFASAGSTSWAGVPRAGYPMYGGMFGDNHVPDPDDDDIVYSSCMRVRISDNKLLGVTLDRYTYTSDERRHMENSAKGTFGVFNISGRKLLYTGMGFHCAAFLLEPGVETAKPVMTFTPRDPDIDNAVDWPPDKPEGLDGDTGFIWTDLDGDGIMEAGEYEVFDNPAGQHELQVVEGGHLYLMPYKVDGAIAADAHRLLCQGVTVHGAPIYETPMQDLPLPDAANVNNGIALSRFDPVSGDLVVGLNRGGVWLTEYYSGWLTNENKADMTPTWTRGDLYSEPRRGVAGNGTFFTTMLGNYIIKDGYLFVVAGKGCGIRVHDKTTGDLIGEVEATDLTHTSYDNPMGSAVWNHGDGYRASVMNFSENSARFYEFEVNG